MSRFPAQSTIAVIMVFVVSSTLLASGPVIGVVTGPGTFRVANGAVHDNATLFDGNTIVTGDATPLVQLKDGARIQLGTGTTATFKGHVVDLSLGISEIRFAPEYSVTAKTLRIAPASKDARVTVQVVNDHRILVAANSAPVNVFNRDGLTVAMVTAGETLSFDPFAGPAQATSLTGCLLTKVGTPILVDPQTYQVSQLSGGSVVGEVGNRVTITGEVTQAGKTIDIAGQVLQVASVARVAAGGCAAVAADPRIKADPPGGIAAEHHSSHAGWIILGVAVAGGAVAGVVIATHKSSTPASQ